MIKETENMRATKNKRLKQCKLKFVNCYRLNDGVANVPVFAGQVPKPDETGRFP